MSKGGCRSPELSQRQPDFVGDPFLDAHLRSLVEAAARAQEITPTDELEAGIVREPAVRYAGDPCWIVARYPGACRRCGETVPAGVRSFSYPHGRTLLCEECGGPAAAEVEEAARLEASGASPW